MYRLRLHRNRRNNNLGLVPRNDKGERYTSNCLGMDSFSLTLIKTLIKREFKFLVMKEKTRRKFMIAGATLFGAGTVGKDVVQEIQQQLSTPPQPPLDASDVRIQRADLNIYLYDKGDWDAEATVEIENTSSKYGYLVSAPIYIVDSDGDQQGKTKSIELLLGLNETKEVKKIWDATDSRVKDGEELVIEQLTVESRRILKRKFSDTRTDVYGVNEQ
jgi:hypothetical protein